MNTMRKAFILTVSLLLGCATYPQPVQQEALISIAIAVVIENSKNPQDLAKIVLKLADAPLSISATTIGARSIIYYDKLTPSQQLSIDVLLDELDRQLLVYSTPEDKDAILALWRRAAIAAASRFTAIEGNTP